MSFVAWHPIFKHSLPEGHRFPMIKYELLHDQLLYQGVVEKNDFFEPEILAVDNLEGVHWPDYYHRLLVLDLTASEIRRIGFPLSHQLVERELRIAEGTVQSSLSALEKGIGFNIAGGTHHAGSNWGEGFCLLNDQAIAAHYLWKRQGIDKIAIIDLDVHQGNGTAEIFKSRGEVFTFSMHGKNNFPFKKEISDMDVHLQDGISGAEYLAILNEKLDLLFQKVKPHFVFYQAGADVLETDNMGKLKLTKQDCLERDRIVFHHCRTGNIPVQVSMGGGYSKRVADIVDVHCQTFKEGISVMMH